MGIITCAKRGIAIAVSMAALFVAPIASAQSSGPGYVYDGDSYSIPVQPSTSGTSRTVKGERYKPTIWVDPDGCEHWVMDDGAEGFMSPHLTRDGLPVCRDINLCGTVKADHLFATNKSQISAGNREKLRQFFATADAWAFLVYGHTDSRASDEYNLRLSLNRANAVARVGAEAGASIVGVRGFGERRPIATNKTADGMRQNRRVEIFCLK